jgi:ABC-2 type transport system ATP-binding protein
VDVVAAPRRARHLVSVVLGGERGFYNRLSARDNIRYFGVLGGLSRRQAAAEGDAALERAGLAAVASQRVETFSKGMKQRLHLATALLTKPTLLLLDEPTVGLDPLEAERFRQTVASVRSDVTVLLTSHYLADIERLAERVVILQGGAVTHDLPLDHLLERASAAAEVTISGFWPPPVDGGEPAHGVRVLDIETSGERWNMTFEIDEWSPLALRALADLWPEAAITDVRVQSTSLERVFAELAR